MLLSRKNRLRRRKEEPVSSIYLLNRQPALQVQVLHLLTLPSLLLRMLTLDHREVVPLLTAPGHREVVPLLLLILREVTLLLKTLEDKGNGSEASGFANTLAPSESPRVHLALSLIGGACTPRRSENGLQPTTKLRSNVQLHTRLHRR